MSEPILEEGKYYRKRPSGRGGPGAEFDWVIDSKLVDMDTEYQDVIAALETEGLADLLLAGLMELQVRECTLKPDQWYGPY